MLCEYCEVVIWLVVNVVKLNKYLLNYYLNSNLIIGIKFLKQK